MQLSNVRINLWPQHRKWGLQCPCKWLFETWTLVEDIEFHSSRKWVWHKTDEATRHFHMVSDFWFQNEVRDHPKGQMCTGFLMMCECDHSKRAHNYNINDPTFHLHETRWWNHHMACFRESHYNLQVVLTLLQYFAWV